MRKFNKLYKYYKDNFDLELILTAQHKTFKQAEAEALKAEEWL